MKNWVVSELDRGAVRRLMADYGIPAFTAMLLTIRGITGRDEIERFFSQETALEDPLLIKDMKEAVDRIREAVLSAQKICVYGDYDCDGVTATAILYSYLEAAYADVMYYIPDRNAEGYGMNCDAVRRLHEQGVKLIITVDNGISAIEETDLANSLGIDVVVTDHHKPLDILPKAVAVVNPHRSDESFDFIDYSGAGLALKLICALENDINSIVENYADLAAIGTVADIVPLTGENRQIVKAGISCLKNTERIGLATLIRKTSASTIDSGSIGFRIGPRINAAGRLGSPYDALSLLLTDDPDDAEEKSELLSGLNSKRQSIEAEITEDIINRLASSPELTCQRVLVISAPDWNPGVIGIVSSKITEKYGKPSIIISESEDICKASGRSVAGFSLVDAVFACSKYLEKYGGHPMAVGFSIKKENIPAFIEAINKYADQYEHMPLAELSLDCSLNPDTISIEMVRELQRFEPFGCANPKPVFGLKSMQLDRIVPVGGGKHLKLSVSRNKVRLSLMLFSTTPEEFPYQEGDCLDFAVGLDINVYQGRESISFTVRDVHFSGFDTEQMMYEIQDYEQYKKGMIRKGISGKCPVRDDFAALYIYLRKSGKKRFTIDELCFRLRERKIGAFMLMMMLEVFGDIGLLRFWRDADVLNIELTPVSGLKFSLDSSLVYNKLKGDIKNAG